MVGLAMLLLARVPIDAPLWAVLLVFFIFGFGMGNVIAPGSTVLQNVLPLARAGAGSAVQNTVRQVAGALGVADRRHGARHAVRRQPHLRHGQGAGAVPRGGEAGGHRVDRRRRPHPRPGGGAGRARRASSIRCAPGRTRPSSAPRHVTSYISLVMIVIAALLVVLPPAADHPAGEGRPRRRRPGRPDRRAGARGDRALLRGGSGGVRRAATRATPA